MIVECPDCRGEGIVICGSHTRFGGRREETCLRCDGEGEWEREDEEEGEEET